MTNWVTYKLMESYIIIYPNGNFLNNFVGNHIVKKEVAVDHLQMIVCVFYAL